ncbi:MAG: hypothetical protein K5636_07120 [Bacteroidales bacterium]|nr:hypothetical protein [Bacteroidales bacterium]
MKKLFVMFGVCAFLFASTQAFAQVKEKPVEAPKEKMCEKSCDSKFADPEVIAQFKMEYLHNHLKYEGKQNDAFWKAYDKYNKAQQAAQEKYKKALEKEGIPANQCCMKEGNDKLSPAQKTKAYTLDLGKRQSLLAAEQTFFKEISKALNKEQIAQYLDAVRDCNRELAMIREKEANRNAKHSFKAGAKKPSVGVTKQLKPKDR